MMRIYIQSESGDLNSEFAMYGYPINPDIALTQALESLRKAGGYLANYRNARIMVPFEKIKFIRKIEEQSEQAQTEGT